MKTVAAGAFRGGSAASLFRVLSFTFGGGRITEVELIGDPDRLQDLSLAVVPEAM
jgi:hypothetical protein